MVHSQKMWLYHITGATRPLVRPWWAIRLEGATETIPRTGPAVVVANHSSFLDPWFLGPLAFPRTLRFLITRKWYDKSRIWNTVFRAYHTIPVETDARATQESVCSALRRGEAVAIFPEGRISFDGSMQRFHTGFCHIAARSGAPVIPIGIRGAFESLPRNRRFPKPGRVTIVVGRPMTFPGSPRDTQPPQGVLHAFREEVFSEVLALAGRRRVGKEEPSATIRAVEHPLHP